MFDDLQESAFSSADWAEVTKLKLAFEQGGQNALVEALTALVHDNRACYLHIMEVLNPGYTQWNEDMVREQSVIADELKEESEKKTD